jgi:hypothetical protein
VANEHTRKPRTEYIYGTTKGVVSQLEFTVDTETGEIGFGPNVANTYYEASYDRPKRPKVLSRVPQEGETLTFNIFTALRRNYDFEHEDHSGEKGFGDSGCNRHAIIHRREGRTPGVLGI